MGLSVVAEKILIMNDSTGAGGPAGPTEPTGSATPTPDRSTGTTGAIADYWDAAASTFDDEPDHGLKAEHTRTAWAQLVSSWSPNAPADVLDVGCGTGSISLLLAESGHRVTGVDLAPRMIEQARRKLNAAGLPARFIVGDASAPPTGGAHFDMVLSRHLVWTLPDPEAALAEWCRQLRPGGRLVLVEGRWRESADTDSTYLVGAEPLPWSGGISAAELATAVSPLVAEVRIEPLSGIEALWGGPVHDERYALIARTTRT